MRNIVWLTIFFPVIVPAQQLPVISSVEHQPLAAQVTRLLDALQFLGDPLPTEETAELRKLAATPGDPHAAVVRPHWPGPFFFPRRFADFRPGR